MLNIGKLAAGREAYYLSQVADGVEDYYLASGEAPGRWMGGGVESLGLAGTVEGEDLRAVLAGAQPDGAGLVRQGKRTPGFDLTFRAPKSVSLLHALGTPGVEHEVCAAHDVAVDQAVMYLERHACATRRGAGGRFALQGDGFVAAAFRHQTSRAGDPTLHTHVLLANLVRADGRWGALDGRLLYAESKTAAYVYQAALRHELTRRLGVDWQPVRYGMADIAGFSRRQVEEFSTRRREIVAELERLGASSPQAAQVATLTTRAPKRDVPRAELVAGWWNRAEAVGLTSESIDHVLGRVTADAAPEPATTASEVLGPKGLTGRRSTFDRRDVAQAWCGALPHGAPVEVVERLTDDALRSLDVIPLGADALSAKLQRSLRTDDGRRIPGPAVGRFTTVEMAATEARLVASAHARRADGVAVVDVELVDAALRFRPELDGDQRAMVRQLTTSGAGVEIVVGKAGAGKTTALAAARVAWDAWGTTVIGCSLAARAAQELESGAGIPSATLHRLFQELGRDGIPIGAVVVVDEAAMVGTRALASLADAAARAEAKLVLVGDDRQLPAIDAGGGFRALCQAVPTIRLDANRRQSEAWEREALDQVAEGRPGQALNAYVEHDRVHVAENSAAAREKLVDDWLTARLDGRGGPMIALHRRDVDDLNLRARSALRDAGMLIGEDHDFGGRSFAVGDDVIGLQNDYRTGILNGTRGIVTSVGSMGLSIRTADGGTLNPQYRYLRQGWLDHGYALTIHKAQGATFERSFVLADDALYREAGYVALSRAREDTRLYTVADDGLDEHETHDPPEPMERLRSALARSRAEPSIRELSVDHGVSL